MHRLSLLLTAAVSAIAFTQIASAADLPRKALVAPPPVPVIYNWTGFYIGGNVGGVRQHVDGVSNFHQPIGGLLLLDNPQSNSLSDSSIIGGLQLGYNWQINNWLLGLEGDWSWLNTGNSFCRVTNIQALTPCSDTGSGFLTLTSETDWIATIRGRVGFTWDRFLVYGTGGVAWGKVSTSINANCLVAGCGASGNQLNETQNFSDTKSGWTAGGGVEAMVTANWTVRAEYLHVDLGTISNTANLANSGLGTFVSWSRDVKYDIVRFAVNYKFGGIPFATR